MDLEGQGPHVEAVRIDLRINVEHHVELAGQARLRPTSQQCQSAAAGPQSRQDRRRREDPHARGGELDSERQSIEAAADLGDRCLVVGRRRSSSTSTFITTGVPLASP